MTTNPVPITQRIKTFEDACNELGIKTHADAYRILNLKNKLLGETPIEQCDDAALRLLIIIQALNEGWKPDWKNSSEYKYYPWFDMSSGSGLSCCVFDLDLSLSGVGSRLVFKSRALAEYAGKQFTEIYSDFFIIQ